MNKRKIEELRDILNSIIMYDDLDNKELLKKSEEMDRLLLKEIRMMNLVGGDKEKIVELEKIIDKLEDYKNVYNYIRIINPIYRKVFVLSDDSLVETESPCYELWLREEICETCISYRAYEDDDIRMKIEKINEKFCVVYAIPIDIKDKKMVIEIIADTTDCIDPSNSNMIEIRKLSNILKQ